MKKERKFQVQKILVIFLLLLVIFPTFTNIFGVINENYKGAVTSVSSGLNITGNETNNLITRVIFWFINTLASMGEHLLTNFATVLASVGNVEKNTALMPWADAIIYNGVPALDINFINPSKGSFSSILSDVIGKIYYTIFSLSITFFGVAVLIMAIKLATTAIAAEKARYKESITNFIISLILIFSMHYLISFIFYLNESIVKIAFSITEMQLEGEFANLISASTGKQKELVESAVSSTDDWFSGRDTADKFKVLNNYIKTTLFDDKKMTNAAAYLSAGYGDFLYDNNGDGWNSSDELGRSVVLTCMAKLVVNKHTFDESDINAGYGGDWKKDKAAGNQLYFALKDVYDELFKGRNKVEREFEPVYQDCFDVLSSGKYSEKEQRIMRAINNAIANSTASSIEEDNNEDETTKMADLGNSAVSQLSVYFKINRYNAEGEIDLVGVLIYAIFVIQSLMYFFAYLKRYFYIIVLSFFAPLLVLFDFFNKAIGKQSDTFSKWLKEFCALVFLQSIQAFLLSMISSLIVSINGLISEGEMFKSGTAVGISVINIIALASMAKLEDLIVDMLGLKSSITDATLGGGAKMGAHGMAGLMMAGGAVRRIADNGKKLVGGIGGIASANRDRKRALQDKQKKQNRYLARMHRAQGSGSNGGGSNGGGSDGSGNGSGTSGNNGLNYKDLESYENAMEACDAKIAEAKKRRNAAIREHVSGWVESAGSIAGFLGGAAIGTSVHLAEGNASLGAIAQDAVKGAGVGDVIGEGFVKVPTGIYGFGKDVKAGATGKNAISKDIARKKEIIANMYKDAGFDVSDI